MEGRHLALLGTDWNFGLDCLEMTGVPRKSGMLIWKPPIETCATAGASTTMGYCLASAAPTSPCSVAAQAWGDPAAA
eukprot:5618859-Pyramimonas_sp.AAC.1